VEKDNFLKSIGTLLAAVTGFFLIGMIAGCALGQLIMKRSPKLTDKIRKGFDKSLIITAFVCLIFTFYPLNSSISMAVFIVFSFSMGLFMTVNFQLRLFSKKSKTDITTKDFKAIDQKIFKSLLSPNPEMALIGYSMKHNEGVYLSKNERVKHTVIAGSTGSGKTTTLKSLFIDAMRNNYPVLIIDPKGNVDTINEFKNLIKKYSKEPRDLEIFSLISPDSSYRYNPLKRGSSVQIKDRLMSCLEWSEQYYKNQSSTYVGQVIHLFKELGLEITVKRINLLLKDKKYAEKIEDLIAVVKDQNKKELLNNSFRKLLKSDAHKLDNLISQMADLDNEDTGVLLNTDSNQFKEIDLLSVIKDRKIAYFQLNTMAYPAAAKVIGKLILSDLKCLASEIHGGKVIIDKPFFPIFVDEFGSFCNAEFIEMQKMCRDVNFALHLFFQSLADLDVVSPEFKSQVQQNCITKVILRTDDPQEVEFWSSVAGTSETTNESFQYQKFLGMNLKTGMGNSRVSRGMKVEHDVFKQLNVGQSVLIQKSPSKEDLIQLWNPT